MINAHKRAEVFFFFLFFFGFCVPARAEISELTETAKAYIGDNQTKNDARNLATLEAKRRALEKAGTYMESLTIVENSIVKKDEILAFTAGVSKTEILSEKPFVEGETYGLEVTAKVTVDTSVVEERLKQFKQDRTVLEQNKALLERNKEIEEELKKAKEALSKLKDQQEVKKYRETKVKEIEDKLSATEWFKKGYDAYYADDLGNALFYFSKAIDIAPNHPMTYYGRGATYYNKGEMDHAISDFTKALSLNPDYAEAYTGRGNAYFNKGEYDQAISDYNKALSLNPDFAMAYYYRGLAYWKAGDCKKAMHNYKKACSLGDKEACDESCL